MLVAEAGYRAHTLPAGTSCESVLFSLPFVVTGFVFSSFLLFFSSFLSLLLSLSLPQTCDLSTSASRILKSTVYITIPDFNIKKSLRNQNGILINSQTEY